MLRRFKMYRASVKSADLTFFFFFFLVSETTRQNQPLGFKKNIFLCIFSLFLNGCVTFGVLKLEYQELFRKIPKLYLSFFFVFLSKTAIKARIGDGISNNRLLTWQVS